MKSGLIIKADNTTIKAEPKNKNDFQLEELKAFVGGYIEIVNVQNGFIMVLDEEGKLKDKPINRVATAIYRDCGHDDIIVGDVVLCKREMVL